jgi:hypothetical protein
MTMNDKAYEYILKKDKDGLDNCKFNTRILIEQLKNNLEGLEFLLDYIGYDPGAGSYFYTDVEDNRTFDLYKKYEIDPINLYKHDIKEEQWEYLYEIGYIDEEQYENECA